MSSGFHHCPYCDGAGCEECDHTGYRYRQSWLTDKGVTVSVTGSGNFNEKLLPLFEQLAEAADVHLKRLDSEAADSHPPPEK